MTQTNCKDSVDSIIDSWTIQKYGNHGKIAIKFSNVPTIKKVDTKNISDYFKMALATLDVQHGMILSLTHVCPLDTDPALLSRIERSRDRSIPC